MVKITEFYCWVENGALCENVFIVNLQFIFHSLKSLKSAKRYSEVPLGVPQSYSTGRWIITQQIISCIYEILCLEIFFLYSDRFINFQIFDVLASNMQNTKNAFLLLFVKLYTFFWKFC